MKFNIKYGLVMWVMSLFISCGKNTDKDLMDKKYLQLRQLGLAERIQAFQLLQAHEKAGIWNKHVKNWQNNQALSQNQQRLVNQLLNYNQAANYLLKFNQPTLSLINFENNWLNKAVKHFPDHQLYELAYTLGSLELDIIKPKTPVNANDPEIFAFTDKEQLRSPHNNTSYGGCHCNVGSRLTCPALKSGIKDKAFYFEASYRDCSYQSQLPCDVDGGCGFMGWSICDGNKCS